MNLFDGQFNGMPHSEMYRAEVFPELFPHEKRMRIENWSQQDREMFLRRRVHQGGRMTKDDTWYLQQVGDEESIVVIPGIPEYSEERPLMKREPQTGRVIVRFEGRMHFDPEPRYVPEHWRYCDNGDHVTSDTGSWTVVATSTGAWLG